MSSRQVLYIQGDGAGTHDDWDNHLVDSLSHNLGADHDVRYPRLPDEDEPAYAAWTSVIRGELAGLDDGAVVVAHSLGAAILMATLAEQPADRSVAAIVLLAAPFVGQGGWPGEEFETQPDLGARLSDGTRVWIFQGLDDQTVPPFHADLWAESIPQAVVERLPGRDHQFNNDLTPVAEVIRAR